MRKKNTREKRKEKERSPVNKQKAVFSARQLYFIVSSWEEKVPSN